MLGKSFNLHLQNMRVLIGLLLMRHIIGGPPSPEDRKILWKKCLTPLKLEYDSLVGRIIKGKNTILVDMVTHDNLGDSFIEYGEFLLLNKTGNTVKRRCSAKYCNWKAVDLQISSDPRPAIILIHGGGNFGDIWHLPSIHHRFLLERFKKYPIVFLPQSVRYVNETVLNEDVALYDKHPDVTIMVRDLQSLSFIRQYFPSKPSLLSPDAAHMIGPIGHSFCEPEVDVLIMKRTDKESEGRMGNLTKHLSILSERKISYKIDDWPFDKIRLPKDPLLHTEFRYEVGKKWLCRGRVIVTDRLHVVLLSTLMDLPHVHLDNYYSKIHTYRMAHFRPRTECRNSVLRARRAISWRQALLLARQQLLVEKTSP